MLNRLLLKAENNVNLITGIGVLVVWGPILYLVFVQRPIPLELVAGGCLALGVFLGCLGAGVERI